MFSSTTIVDPLGIEGLGRLNVNPYSIVGGSIGRHVNSPDELIVRLSHICIFHGT